MAEDKVRSPFSRPNRNKLLSWSKVAKDNGWLDGYSRKVIYEAGHYNYIFLSRLHLLNNALSMLSIELPEKIEDILSIKDIAYQTYLVSKAELGDADAQYHLADGYYYGFYGLEESEELARVFLKKSAKQGNEDALLLLAQWYADGNVVNKDYDKALSIYFGLSERGSCRAKTEISYLYIDGLLVEKNEDLAFEYMEQASFGDYAEAKRQLGIFHSLGIGTSQSQQKAISNWLSASELNDTYSMVMVGDCYYEGSGVEQNYSLALDWYEKAEESGGFGVEHAYFQLGLCNYYGNGCEVNDEKAYHYFQMASDYEQDRALHFIGRCLFFGEGVEKNYREAAIYFEKSLEGNSFSHFYLGECCRNGDGRKMDKGRAFELYLWAAEQNNAKAQMAVGRAFYYGEGVDEDDNEAVKWLSLAAKEDEPEALYMLGESYLKGNGVNINEQQALELLRRSAHLGNDDAENLLFKNGFDLEVTEEGNENVDTIVRPFSDHLTNARRIYGMLVKDDIVSDGASKKQNVLSLSNFSKNRLDVLMENQES